LTPPLSTTDFKLRGFDRPPPTENKHRCFDSPSTDYNTGVLTPPPLKINTGVMTPSFPTENKQRGFDTASLLSPFNFTSDRVKFWFIKLGAGTVT